MNRRVLNERELQRSKNKKGNVEKEIIEEEVAQIPNCLELS